MDIIRMKLSGDVSHGPSVKMIDGNDEEKNMSQLRSNATAIAAIAAAMFTVPATVQAAQQRSFVSGFGSDADNCTLLAPCRSFGSAILQTFAGGEVVVLDSAGYGPVTITGPISIIAPPGVYAGITVSTGVGVTINAGVNDVVVLRGLDINAIAGPTTDGIVVGSGLRVVIDRCTVSNFPVGSGLLVNSSGQTDVDVTDTLIRDNQIGVRHTGSGILNQVTLSRVRLASNGTGVSATGVGLFVRLIESTVVGNSDGLFFDPGVNRTVRFDVERSQIIGNNIAVRAAPTNVGAKVLGVINETLVAENGSFGIVANANAGATATLSVSNSTIRYNGTGLRSQQAGSTIVFRNNRITDHGTGIQSVGGGALLTGQGNLLHDNTVPGAATGPATLL
jgi:hypothetical protein